VRFIRLATFATAILAIERQAKADYVVTFNSLTSTTDQLMASYTEGGYLFSSSNAVLDAFGSWGSTSQNYTGSAALNKRYNNTSVILTNIAGSLFGLSSIDLSEAFNDIRGGSLVSFIGVKADNSEVTQSIFLDGHFGNQTLNFNSSFTDLKSVRWANVEPWHQFDNIHIVEAGVAPSPVPLPPTAIPFGLGAIVFALAGRRLFVI